MADFDLAIIGAGPAGMSAAINARAFGLRVVIFDEKSAPGGQIYADIEPNHRADARSGLRPDEKTVTALGTEYASGAALVDKFRVCGAHYLPHSTVWHASAGEPGGDAMGCVIAYSDAGNNASNQRVSAARMLIATGAQERPVPLAGWTLPGVMSVGGAQLMLKSAGMIPPAPLVIVGAGPLALLYAAQVHALGGTVSAFVEPRGATQAGAALRHAFDALRGAGYLFKGAQLLARRTLQSAKVYRNARDISIDGDNAAQELSFDCGARRIRLTARTVLLHDGIAPQLQLTRLLELEHRWHQRGRYQAPITDRHGRSSTANVFVAGDGRRIDGARAAIHSGAIAALAAVVDLAPQQRIRAREQIKRHEKLWHRETRVRPFLDTLFPGARWPFAQMRDDTLVCRCENISVAAIRAACRAPVNSADHMKALNRCGMGPCQGRMCETSVAIIAAQTLGCHPTEFGLHRIREPIKPISLATLAALAPLEPGRKRAQSTDRR